MSSIDITGFDEDWLLWVCRSLFNDCFVWGLRVYIRIILMVILRCYRYIWVYVYIGGGNEFEFVFKGRV